MSAKANDELIYELTAEMADIRRALAGMQSSPIGNKASALVALAKDSRLDGRIGAGDVVVSVMLAGGGAAIGVVGAVGIQFGAIPLMSTGEAFGLATLTGCGLGLLRMGIDALAIPLMWSEFLEWAAERHERILETKREIAASGPKVVERPLIINGRETSKSEPWDVYSISHADHIIVIREGTDRAEQIEWTYSRLWYFIEDCYRIGEWSRRAACARWKEQFGEGALTQGEHKAVYDFLQAKTPGLWGLTGEENRPTLEAYLKRFRWSPNQPTSQPTNQPGVK
jgi:hypothetical protein